MAATKSRHAGSVIVKSRDPYAAPRLTPGGMVLELPKMLAASDVLTIVNRDDSGLSFELTTFGRDRHQCTIEGLAPPM
jgi:hypothetical protein